MTTLPTWLPAVIAGGLIAAVVFAVVGVASAGLGRLRPQDRRDGAQAGAGGPNSPRGQSGRGEALTGPLSASRGRATGPEPLNAPQGPASGADPPAPQPTAQCPPHAHTDPQETP